jgi:hypothetical protein
MNLFEKMRHRYLVSAAIIFTLGSPGFAKAADQSYKAISAASIERELTKLIDNEDFWVKKSGFSRVDRKTPVKVEFAELHLVMPFTGWPPGAGAVASLLHLSNQVETYEFFVNLTRKVNANDQIVSQTFNLNCDVTVISDEVTVDNVAGPFLHSLEVFACDFLSGEGYTTLTREELKKIEGIRDPTNIHQWVEIPETEKTPEFPHGA